MANLSYEKQIELRFVGDDINPHTVRASDLAEILKATETLVQATVLHEYPELTKEDIALSLTEIQNQSLGLRFTSPIPQVVVPEFERLASLIQRHYFEALPPEANDALRRIATFTRKHHCVAEFRAGDRETALATVASSLVIPAAPRLPMQITIYGGVVEAGGKRPNVQIETLQGQVVVCDGTQSQVKELAERLYDVVGIIGLARGDVVTLEISEFHIQEILPFRAASILEAMRELGDAVAPHFDNLDVNEFVDSQRG